MIPFHHRLVPELFVSPDAVGALRADASRLPAWTMDSRQAGDLALLLTGGYAPLRGYMTQAQHDAALAGAVLPWPAPLALAVDETFGDHAQPGQDMALRDTGDAVLAVMSVTDRWGAGPVRLGGRIKGLRRPDHPAPNDLRRLWRDRGVARVLSVQPTHAGQIGPAVRLAHRLDAVLLIQPPAGMRLDPPHDAVVAPLVAAPPDGPHRALWQGAVARNFGATHLVVHEDQGHDLLKRHAGSIGVQAILPDPTT